MTEAAPPTLGYEVQGIVALPNGDIVTAVLKQYESADAIYTHGAYLEVFDSTFRPLDVSPSWGRASGSRGAPTARGTSTSCTTAGPAASLW